ncbi:MAG: MFS transporter [bacterium]|nr:MFS transporter [bacterium]
MSQTDESRSVLLLAGLMGYWGFADVLNAAAAPFLAREFGLDDVSISRTFGWISIGALGTYALARWADRRGRRRVLLWTLLLMSPLCILTALAPGLKGFIGVQVFTQAFKGLLVILVPVMVTESLSTETRARGHGWVSLAGSLGAGLGMILVASSENVPGTWRWVWGAAAAGILGVPLLRRVLPESQHFERASAAGDTASAMVRDLLGPRYRRRTIALLIVSGLFPMVIAATQTWLIYFPVQHLGLEPVVATAVVIGGGGVALVGFPLGGHLSERWGRRPTFLVSSVLFTGATWGFYHVSGDFPVHPAFGLALGMVAMSLCSSAGVVPLRAAVTELFPTALRATISGGAAIASALGAITAYFATSVLSAWLGGLPAAASLLSLGMPTAGILFFLALPETRGRAIEDEDSALSTSREHREPTR